ncbi:hypothetical protein SLEP1_g49132 [Rubroshorea leprosula]|uniref:Uncharacterized protein n=1 Tax=Rubroshorea leprosula TaxID=152421 RepID=A0AAV5LW36_9ROSI|nr:hypothetical protein SLEP1_g49132 [Rubroshorea leprosula]
MAPKKTPAPPPPNSIGHSEVLLEASKFVCEFNPNSLQISISKNTKIRISGASFMPFIFHRDDMNGKSGNDFQLSKFEKKERPSNEDGYVFLLVNPKEDDSCTKSYLQVIAAVTYQILSADTLHAEIPLAAVSSTH